MEPFENTILPGGLTRAEAEGALTRVLNSPGFVSGGRLGPFLQFLVEETLRGEASGLKESTVGVAVFQREPTYDPRIDPIVRVEARRLRSRLEDYYQGLGKADPVRIDLPKGGYVPAFRRAAFSPESPPETRERAKGPEANAQPRLRLKVAPFLGVALVVAVAAAGIWFWKYRAPAARQVQTSSGIPARMAVLPFVNLNGSPDDEYFSDGLTEELINALSQVEGLRMISRSLAFQYKGKAQDVREVGRSLGADAIVEGSVRRAGNRVRISAQLVDAVGGYQIWSHTYERELKDIFAVQNELAQAIVNALRLQWRMPDKPYTHRYTANIEAYNQFLRAKFQWNRFSDEGIERAIDHCRQAITIDPQYAPAYALLAQILLIKGYYELAPPAEAWPEARRMAERAIAIDDGLAEAHAALASVLAFHYWDWKAAERSFRQALERNPASSAVHLTYGIFYLVPRGELTRADEELRTAIELDPIFVFGNYAYGFCLLAQGKYDAAVKQYERTLELKPEEADVWWDYGMALAYSGRLEEARKAFLKNDEIENDPPGEWGPTEYGLLHDQPNVRKSYVGLKSYSGAPMDKARGFAFAGDFDSAFAELDRAFQTRDPEVVWIKVDPRLAELRKDRRFPLYLRRLNLE